MNARHEYDVVGIGNAIVDVLASVDDDFLAKHELVKGSMALIDADQTTVLSSGLPDPIIAAGGSTSNTMAGIASFGGSGAFVGKVADDELGQAFMSELTSIDVDFLAEPIADSLPTAQSIVLVTPDAQRTMNTYLGVAGQIYNEDIDVSAVAASQILFIEGYLWDSPSAIEAVRSAVATIKNAGGRVALSLSDPFCVDRHREAFQNFLLDSVDIVFGNESEATSLYETDFDKASTRLGSEVPLTFVTRGANGSVVFEEGRRSEIAVRPFADGDVVDTTGAGDQYAAGVLYGLTQGFTAVRSARLGSLAGGEAVTHFGARPNVSLAEFVAETG